MTLHLPQLAPGQCVPLFAGCDGLEPVGTLSVGVYLTILKFTVDLFFFKASLLNLFVIKCKSEFIV